MTNQEYNDSGTKSASAGAGKNGAVLAGAGALNTPLSAGSSRAEALGAGVSNTPLSSGSSRADAVGAGASNTASSASSWLAAASRSTKTTPRRFAGLFSFFTFIGFVLIIGSSFCEFTPISAVSVPGYHDDDTYFSRIEHGLGLPPKQQAPKPKTDTTLKGTGIGIPVVIACVFGCIALFRRNYFAAFFIAVFAAFFITHEIIIIYDNRAVELGQETLRSGYLRSVFELFKDAFRAKGALLGVVGSAIAAFFAMPAMFFDSLDKNTKAALEANANG